MIVDEQTGRIMDGRRYSDGLHQAIEAKENVKIEDATQTFATVTLQNYFRMYRKLSGMTGTAITEARKRTWLSWYGSKQVSTSPKLLASRLSDGAPLRYHSDICKNGGIADADGNTYCGATHCCVTKKNTQFQGSKWAEHVVLECHQSSAEVKAEGAQAHPTGKIRLYYTAPVPSWKRKCTTGTDPTETEEGVDDAPDAGAAG